MSFNTKHTVDDVLCFINKLLSVGQIRILNVGKLGSIFVNLTKKMTSNHTNQDIE
jgi:hypothetical protein